ncbi:hypothetical Protein YC6258_04932 [Gynuella sunshinyii YC6258]|uniref:Uncharacterized protein n=1 Tax=Gynuella sunshinyii YC6258 TaxID=1445510 RepID=A0A0C5W2R6_9GAMM|nr:hypothetical Protein YC6258_04932 [Gynuella sunshinyii YC6258]
MIPVAWLYPVLLFINDSDILFMLKRYCLFCSINSPAL